MQRNKGVNDSVTFNKREINMQKHSYSGKSKLIISLNNIASLIMRKYFIINYIVSLLKFCYSSQLIQSLYPKT